MPDDCSRSRWRADLAIGLLLGVVLGLVVAYAVTIWFWHAPEPLFGPRYRGLAEVFSRVFLVVLIAIELTTARPVFSTLIFLLVKPFMIILETIFRFDGIYF